MTRWGLASLNVVFVLLIAAFLLHWHNRERIPAKSSNSVASVSTSMAAFPAAVAIDSKGNLFVVASKQNRILEVSLARRVTVVAGNGTMGYSGDGGPADQASLDEPLGVALDSADNLFIADTINNRIRRVDAKTHIIVTVAGTGFLGGGVGKVANETGLNQPVSVAFDASDNMYIGGSIGFGVKRVDGVTHLVSRTIGAGSPGAPLAIAPATGPFWVASDGRRSLFFSNPNWNNVSQINFPESDVNIIAGNAVCGFGGDGGPVNGALLCYPEGLFVHSGKELYIADTGNNRIRRVDLETGIITTVAGNGQAGYLGDGGLAVSASLNGPMAITVDANGNLFVADTRNNCIRRVDAGTGTISTWVSARDMGMISR